MINYLCGNNLVKGKAKAEVTIFCLYNHNNSIIAKKSTVRRKHLHVLLLMFYFLHYLINFPCLSLQVCLSLLLHYLPFSECRFAYWVIYSFLDV